MDTRESKESAIVFGARGTLGTALCHELTATGRVVAAAVGHGECDIRDERAVNALVEAHRPKVVFNAAAYTDVDRAELEPAVAFEINAKGAEIVAKAAAAVGAAVVHYSTDFVFDGELARPYHEGDPPSPQGEYAKSKAAGDELVERANPRHFILRVGCLYGVGGRNFPSTIVRRLVAGQTIRADGERLGSPTWVREVASVSLALANTAFYGLYHCTSQGETTWASFAREAASQLGVPAERVQAISSATLALRAPRPRRAVLDNHALKERGLDTLSGWADALRAFITEERRLG